LAAAGRGNPMKEIAPRIVVDENVASGKPVIRGTRVPVALLVAKLAGGMEVDQVAREYEVEREDVLAALSYAARLSALNLREKLVAAEEDIRNGRILSEDEAEAEIARWFSE
jgi:uncharacterized protein (DUF433 family)